MARPLRVFSGLFSTIPRIIALSGPLAPWRRKTTRLEDLPHSIRYDIGVTDTSPVVRGSPRGPSQF